MPAGIFKTVPLGAASQQVGSASRSTPV